MKTEVKATSSGGFGLGTVLFLSFLILKLTGYIAWSWWWVTAPLWLPLALVGSILLGILIVGLIVCAVGAICALIR